MFGILGFILAVILTSFAGFMVAAVKSDAINIENLPVIRDVVDAIEAKLVPVLYLVDNPALNLALCLFILFIVTWAWWPITVVGALILTILNK